MNKFAILGILSLVLGLSACSGMNKDKSDEGSTKQQEEQRNTTDTTNQTDSATSDQAESDDTIEY